MTMRHQPRDEPIELIAVTRGFYRGSMVERGQKFMFTGAQLPRWAIDARLALPPLPHAGYNGDTRPLAAQKASREFVAGVGVGGLP